MIEIPVTTYVRHYLEAEYGPGPYHLDADNKNKLRLEFLSTHVHAIIFSSLYATDSVFVKISESPLLIDYYSRNHHYFNRAIFGAWAFFLDFYHQVECEVRRAREDGLTQVQMNYRIAITKFMKRYQISEEIYSYDNLYKQFMRHKKSRRFYQSGWKIEPFFSKGNKIRIKPL
jgi:hypothetical protein